jgi:hypothetical protein
MILGTHRAHPIGPRVKSISHAPRLPWDRGRPVIVETTPQVELLGVHLLRADMVVCKVLESLIVGGDRISCSPNLGSRMIIVRARPPRPHVQLLDVLEHGLLDETNEVRFPEHASGRSARSQSDADAEHMIRYLIIIYETARDCEPNNQPYQHCTLRTTAFLLDSGSGNASGTARYRRPWHVLTELLLSSGALRYR